MITLYSYPELFGVADNNGYGLKVFAFLKLNDLPFTHQHVFDASEAPRGQLPYITDESEVIGDSDTIVEYLIRRYSLTMDDKLSNSQRHARHFIARMLDNLYWVISYSRWKDEQYWPAFRDALRREHSELTDEWLYKAQQFNAQRYYYQGIGRFAPAAAYARGLADLEVLTNMLPDNSFVFGAKPTSADAAIYGFVANIYFCSIPTPLRNFVASQTKLVRHCTAIHGMIR